MSIHSVIRTSSPSVSWLRWCRARGVSWALAGVFLSGAVASSVLAEPVVIYRESFTFCTGSLGNPAADQAGWFGLRSGSRKGRLSNLKVFSYGSPRIGGAVNSKPQGLSQGYSFWSRATYGLTALTEELSFPAALLTDPTTEVSYEQRLSGVNPAGEPNRTQLAFLIDGVWFISQQAVAQNNGGVGWESVRVQPAALTYGVVVTPPGLGPTIPERYDAGLPAAGVVQAVGVFLTEVNGRVRLDNFTITAELPEGSPISTAVLEPQTAACPAGSPDQQGLPPPTVPTPGSDGSDGGDSEGGDDESDSGGAGTDRNVPDEPPPPQLKPPTLAYAFCPSSEVGQGRIVRVSARIRRALLKPVRTPTPADLRDQAVVTILSTRSLPWGALVNVRVADLSQSAGQLRVTPARNQVAKDIKLSGRERAALLSYLAALQAGTDPEAPLFVKSQDRSGVLLRSQALCAGELKTVVTRRARRAHVTTGALFAKPSARRK